MNTSRPYWLRYLVLNKPYGVLSEDALTSLRRGVLVKGKRTRLADVALMGSEPELWPRAVPTRARKHIPTAWLRIRIQEGMNRQIRRMTAAVGYPTLRIVRMRIGPINLGGLQPGEWRELTNKEVAELPAIYPTSPRPKTMNNKIGGYFHRKSQH